MQALFIYNLLFIMYLFYFIVFIIKSFFFTSRLRVIIGTLKLKPVIKKTSLKIK